MASDSDSTDPGATIRSHRLRIVERILRNADAPELFDLLAEGLSATDLQSLLLAVYARRAASTSPARVLAQYRSNRFVRPSLVAPLDLARFEELAFDGLPGGFEALVLSPVAPLGTSSVVAPVDQYNIVTTIRNTEVCSDTTNVLALEAAARRSSGTRDARTPETKLAASHRLLRAQVFRSAASFAHFQILSLCTAGRNRGNLTAEAGAVVEQILYNLRLFVACRKLGYFPRRPRIVLFPLTPAMEETAERSIVPALSNAIAEIDAIDDAESTPKIETSSDEKSYYRLLRFHIYASDDEGTEYFLTDGGFTTWTQQLLNDRKEYFLISGLGSERLLLLMKNGTD